MHAAKNTACAKKKAFCLVSLARKESSSIEGLLYYPFSLRIIITWENVCLYAVKSRETDEFEHVGTSRIARA